MSELWEMAIQDSDMYYPGSGLGVFLSHFLAKPPTLHVHEIMIAEWCDYKLLFSHIAIRHATVNKSLNHCSFGLGQRTIQKPLLQMVH